MEVASARSRARRMRLAFGGFAWPLPGLYCSGEGEGLWSGRPPPGKAGPGQGDGRTGETRSALHALPDISTGA